MKTMVAVVAAGLIGGGAAIGAVAAGLVPLPDQTSARKLPTQIVAADETPQNDGGDYDAEISRLNQEVDRLRLELQQASKAPSDAQIQAMIKAEVDKAKIALPAKTVVAPVDGPEAGTSNFESAWREMNAKVEAEKTEQTRLDRQANRLRQLENSKVAIAEAVPTFLATQKTRLRLEDSQVESLTQPLVTYAQQRAEIRSEQQGLRIDGQEVDAAAFDERLKAVDAATLSVLTGIVGQESAESLLRAAQRIGGGGATMRGGEAPQGQPQNPRQGGNRERQMPRRGGNVD